jgi:hypothetical protein
MTSILDEDLMEHSTGWQRVIAGHWQALTGIDKHCE